MAFQKRVNRLQSVLLIHEAQRIRLQAHYIQQSIIYCNEVVFVNVSGVKK